MSTSKYPTIPICLNDGGRSQSRRPKQKSDCTVIATAIAFDMAYDDAFDLMNISGRTNNKGIVYSHFLKTIPDYCTQEQYKAMYAKDVINNYPEGTYIVIVKAHTYVVRDGIVNDTYPWNMWDTVYSVWKVIKPFNLGDLLL